MSRAMRRLNNIGGPLLAAQSTLADLERETINVRKALAEEFSVLVDQRDSLADFVRDEVGTTCKVRRSGRPQWSCRDERDSAVQALTTGEQPHPGPRWGVEPGTDTRAWTEKAAVGRNLCLHCKAADLLARVLGENHQPDAG